MSGYEEFGQVIGDGGRGNWVMVQGRWRLRWYFARMAVVCWLMRIPQGQGFCTGGSISTPNDTHLDVTDMQVFTGRRSECGIAVDRNPGGGVTIRFAPNRRDDR